MKARKVWLRKDFFSTPQISTFEGFISMVKPEDSFYYPERHELIRCDQVKIINYPSIPSYLDEVSKELSTDVSPIWIDAVKSISLAKKFDNFWCNTTNGFRQCGTSGAETQFNHSETAALIPAIQLDKSRSFIDYIVSEKWKVSPESHYCDHIDRIISEININETAQDRPVEITVDQFEQLKYFMLSLDSVRADFPTLDAAWLDDANLGLWEFAASPPPEGNGEYLCLLLPQPVECRNPEKDIKNGAVAIDFGTSSTVVAVKENGRSRPIRIGAPDLSCKVEQKNFQNPTVVEFIDVNSLSSDWKGYGNQPLTRWDDIHVSYDAKNSIYLKAPMSAVASTLQNLKQIPSRQADGIEFRLIDQKGCEFGIPQLEIADIPLGAMPGVPEDIDPIELYAYYIGLAVNRRNTIYLDYCLTFPVNYPSFAKQIVSSSFKRGLMRSLPPQVCHSRRYLEFNLRIVANEPAAYAASWLCENDMATPEQQVYWSVFDFGGGTTDFAFGIYRPASEAEELEGYEFAFEHFGASGDLFLGGESLLENMAYLIFQQNIECCRALKLQFTKPADAMPFPGGEALISGSWIAKTNTALLISSIRDIWEQFPGRREPEETRELNLLDNSGALQNAKMKIDMGALGAYLEMRLTNAVTAFFVAMRAAFENHADLPNEVNLLLAGNGAKSTLLKMIFDRQLAVNNGDDTSGDTDDMEDASHDNQPAAAENHEPITSEFASGRACDNVFAEWCYPVIRLHEPMKGDENDPSRPTCKTGVALGLLELLPGSRIKIIPSNDVTDEAPFRYFVGIFCKRIFKPFLKQGDEYFKWRDCGPIANGVVDIVYSINPTVLETPAKRHDIRLCEKPVEFDRHIIGLKLFLRAVAPEEIELTLARTVDDLHEEAEPAVNPIRLKLSMEI